MTDRDVAIVGMSVPVPDVDRTEHLLREAKKNAHKLEGLIYAVCDIDEVIALIRSSSTREEAIEKLIARRFHIPANHKYAAKIPQRLMTAASAKDGVNLTRVQAERALRRLVEAESVRPAESVAERPRTVNEVADELRERLAR